MILPPNSPHAFYNKSSELCRLLGPSDGLLFHNQIREELPTIQPELMDACLGWMACISIDASWLLS